MEQKKYQVRQELPSEIAGRIDRILEEMRIEGISVLEFPEQLLAVMIIEIVQNPKKDRWKENPFFFEKQRVEIEWKFSKIRHDFRENSDLAVIFQEILLISSRQVLMNLWELGERLCAIYSELELELELAYGGKRDFCFQSLAGVMDYLVEAVHHRGDKGLFFTPYNLAALAVGLVNPQNGEVWDPAFGSGTLLIQAAKWAENYDGTCHIIGNEMNQRLVRFARVNALYHGIPLEFVKFEETDTIEEARKTWEMEKYDYIIANPPVSSVSDNTREEFGFIAPTRKLHLQFLQVILKRLKEDGRAAVLINESFLFAGGGAEKKIREAIVEHFGLRAVISLPQGAFLPYTSAKASILFFDRSLTHKQPVSFYELKTLGYTFDKKRQQISENDIPQVLEAEADRENRYMEWTRHIELKSQFNEQGIIVPSNWQYETGWFAKRESIREKNYNLMGSIYSMTKKELRKPEASPKELIQQLKKMEQESVDLLEKLLALEL